MQALEGNSVETTVIDETDFQILNMLVRNGRASFASIGDAVGLSPHGAADRVRRLERGGIITAFTATIDLGTVGRALDAFIDVRMLPKTATEKFERFVQTLPAVQE